MDKGIGFNRNIRLAWLDAAAGFCRQGLDPLEVRARLEPVVAADHTGAEAIRKSIDILINIWHKSGQIAPHLHQEALRLYAESEMPAERAWLHYGLTLVYYPFFFQCATVIGQLSRYEEPVTNRLVVNRLTEKLGELGSLARAARRVVWSLRDWDLLADTEKRHVYRAPYQAVATGNLALEGWLLRCALLAHAADELLFADLVGMPALFPFRFAVSIAMLRQMPGVVVQRQGASMNMVRLADEHWGVNAGR